MPTPPIPTLRARGLTKRYGGTIALSQFNMELLPGEVVAFVGHNGAGKSTVSKIIAGFVSPDEGTLEIGDQPVTQWNPRNAGQLGIALVPQQFAVVPELTIEENIVLGHSSTPEAIKAVAKSLGLESLLSKAASEVSPATHRLAMIGRALIRNPEVIILDEPTAAFSSAETQRLFEIIKGLKERGIAFIYISHRLQEVLDISDRVIGMTAGKIICDLPASELTRDSLADIISGSHDTYLGGQSEQQRDRARLVVSKDVLFKVTNLGTDHKLSDVSFEIHRGEVLGITGLIGAGRSSLLNTLWGMYGPPQTGSCEVAGSAFVPLTPRASMRKGLAFVPEGRMQTSVIPDLDVAGNVTLATLRSGAKFRNPFVNEDAETKLVGKVLDSLDTKPSGAARMYVDELSGGNQQKVIIARWLLSSAQIFMFDEPSEGVDVAARQEIYAALRELAESGCAVLISSSDVEEVVEYSDRILIMRDGSIVEEVPVEKQNVEYVSRACL